MKLILPLIFCVFFSGLHAQWSNQTNLFTDSNHMPVSTATDDQLNSLSIRSYPDSGYIIFWEDSRNNAATNTDIYAQKFNKYGKRLWAVNGVPVSTGPNRQRFYAANNLDNRNYSYAATDSAGGFYVTYIDDSSNQYAWPRIIVQHITSKGTRVFGTLGYIIAQAKGNGYDYDAPQLIADGNKGFYISYKRHIPSYTDMYVYCYRDEGSKLKLYGGGQMDENVYLTPTGCGSNMTIAFRDATVIDYMIYPDLQNGCNVVMSLSESGLGNESRYTGFNRLIRVKKTTVTKRYGDNTNYTYKKDTVVAFYHPFYHTYQFYCGNKAAGVGTDDVTTGTGYILESNGFLKVGNYGNDVFFAQGTTLATDGNINADVITSNIRRYLNNNLTNWITQRFVTRSEKFTDMPYEFKDSPYTPRTFVDNFKPGLNTIAGNTDTLLSNNSSYRYNYCLKSTGNKIYATTYCYKDGGTHYDVLLQQLQLNRKSSTAFSVDYTAGKNGVLIGKDTSTGFSYKNIKYSDPQIATDNNGNAVFYVNDYGSFVRVSPIINGTQLAWGAMGRTAGAGDYRGNYYVANAPFMIIDPLNGTGVMNWQDGRNYDGYNSNNIMMRHLDKLLTANYYPPYKPVQPASIYGTDAFPVSLTGSSKHYTLVELLNTTSSLASPVADVLDNYKLGILYTSVRQNAATTIRTYNGKAYLDRNLNIRTETNIAAGTKVTVRLFFTTADFNALKAKDATVSTPANLIIIRQPSSGSTAPDSYVPTGKEVRFSVQSYKAVNNGYYIQAVINGFVGDNNYFIFPSSFSGFSAVVADASTIEANSFIRNIYPTPTTDGVVFIQTGNAHVQNMQVEVMSADGKLCLKKQLPYQSQSININSFANGLYKVRITSGDFMYSGSIIKASGK